MLSTNVVVPGRRTFIGRALAAAAAAGSVAAPAGRARAQGGAGKAGGRPGRKPELYELRTYHLRIGPQPKLLNDFLGEVLVPALGRLGCRPVGAFEVMFGPQIPQVWLLIPHESAATFGAAHDKLPEELARAKGPAALAFLQATQAAPAFVRVESRLLQAFDSLPRLELPAAAARQERRIFELRTYETPSDAANAKKMEMFTPRMGELEIFRRVGLTPVFFGRTIIGPGQPSFTYMLTFPDLTAREEAWNRFRTDPAWLALRATPGYSDPEIMTNISDLVLRPTAYSQI
jgi:hypothetical protein